MAGENLQNINIKIGSRSYPVKVEADEKASLLEVEKEINSKIQSFKKQYAEIDNIDALSMTLISYSFDLSKQSMEANKELLDKQLTSLEQALENALS